MKLKKIALFIFFTVFLFLDAPDVHADFNIQNKNATYNSNTGLLTLYHSELNATEYKAVPSKFKLGNVVINATTTFESGIMKMYVLNKNEVNQQNNFSTTGLLTNALTMSYGALIKSYRPPNSINIVFETQSNEKVLNVNVIGLGPPIQIEGVTSDIRVVEGENKKITILVRGKNLNTGIFELRDLNSSRKYPMTTESTVASAMINIPTNYMETKRIDTFILYLNGQETTQRVSIEVLPYKDEIIPPEQKPIPVDPPNNVTDDSNNPNQGTKEPEEEEDKSNTDQDNSIGNGSNSTLEDDKKNDQENKNDDQENKNDDQENKNDDQENKKDSSDPISKKEVSSKQNGLIIIGSFGVIVAICIWGYIKYRR